MNKWYVYILLREDTTPYYVGKGRGRRCYGVGGRLLPLTEEGKVDRDRIQIVFESEVEEECYLEEEKLISLYGRVSEGGLLINKQRGGNGKSGGEFLNEYHREYQREYRKLNGRNPLTEKQKEERKEYMLEYKQQNKEKLREYRREYKRRKRLQN